MFVFPDRGGCAETPLLIHMIIVVLGGLVQWFGVWVVYALALRVFVAALAVDLTALCWSFRAPLWLGPSCLDTESDAPLTGDRTVVSGGCVGSVSSGGEVFLLFWRFFMAARRF